jgi:TIR domain
MSGISNAVFLSYASEDTQAAERIATALRRAGIEVWFDKTGCAYVFGRIRTSSGDTAR